MTGYFAGHKTLWARAAGGEAILASTPAPIISCGGSYPSKKCQATRHALSNRAQHTKILRADQKILPLSVAQGPCAALKLPAAPARTAFHRRSKAQEKCPEKSRDPAGH